MKNYFALAVAVFTCFAQTCFAQWKAGNPPAQKQPLLQVQMVHITPVSSLFVPVHIDTVKPFTVSLPPIIYGNHESAACAQFKKLKATLVLNAVRANDITASLQWDTKYAFYATGFDVERSLGDSLHFLPVHFTAASAATSFKKKYHLPDYNNYSGLSFYRIKQRNGDSAFIYSNIVSVKGLQPLPFKIYPVPAHDKVFIHLIPEQSGYLTIMVCDLAGKIIQQQTTSCTQKAPVETGIDISKLAASLYQVRIVMPDKTILSGNFVKQ